jgi:tetratricopeptide (TPR) repeat protein
MVTMSQKSSVPQAAKSVSQALMSDTPHDRQILRVAARLFLHLDDPERAHDLLKRNDATKSDPWLMAGEIALSSLAERNPTFLKAGNALLEGGNFQPLHMSELAAAIGTVHLRDGNRRARKLFTTSLIDPTGNSLAQAEWANPHLGQLVSPQRIFSVQDSGEARAFQAYWGGDFQRIIDECELWKNEEPYSTRPYMVGSMAAITLDNVDLAIKYARAGLERDRDSAYLKNHLAYALIARKEFKEASQILVQCLSKTPEDATHGPLLATSGMLAFRTGELETGMKLYKAAIALFKKLGHQNSEVMASVYFAVEAARAGAADATKLVDDAEQLCKNLKFLPEASVVLARARNWQAAIAHRASERSALNASTQPLTNS